jgi:hypothetical protein
MTSVIDQRWKAVLIAMGCIELHPAQVRSETDELRIKLDALGVATGQLEAMAVSPTSVLTGQTSLVVGGNQFGGSAQDLKRKNGQNFGAITATVTPASSSTPVSTARIYSIFDCAPDTLMKQPTAMEAQA